MIETPGGVSPGGGPRPPTRCGSERGRSYRRSRGVSDKAPETLPFRPWAPRLAVETGQRLSRYTTQAHDVYSVAGLSSAPGAPSRGGPAAGVGSTIAVERAFAGSHSVEARPMIPEIGYAATVAGLVLALYGSVAAAVGAGTGRPALVQFSQRAAHRVWGLVTCR